MKIPAIGLDPGCPPAGSHLHGVVALIARKSLMFMSLWMISKGERSGYEIMKEFRKGGMTAATPSRIYPLVAQLEKEGFVSKKVVMQGKRKTIIYRITPKGKRVLYGASQWLRSGLRGRFFKEMLAYGKK